MQYILYILIIFLGFSASKKIQYFLYIFLLFVGYSLSTHNPYRRNVELLLHEPHSGPYTKYEAAAVQEFWITQQVDHFNRGDSNATWQMRYLQNDKYHKPQGPIYIFVGGEWTITPGLMSTGLTHDMAVENAGMLYYTEHRYYGQSWPFEENSLSWEQLQYLTLEQALADLAHFIRYQKSNSINLSQSKVILVGGSYSGSMAAWMTRLYPDLISASWASSAPLLAKADFYEYMQLVGESLELSYGRNCTARVRQGMQHLVDLFNTNETHDLLVELNACKGFDANDFWDRTTFFSGIGNYFALVVQSFSDYIPALCDTLMTLHSSDSLALQRFLQLLYVDERHGCQDFRYQSMLQLFSEHADPSAGTRAWFYQTCNQFGWYTTTIRSSSSSSSIPGSSLFGQQVPLRYFERLCRDAFGAGQTPARLARGIAKINEQFDGYELEQSSSSTHYRQVLFTHGQLDPWRALGQQRGQQATVIAGYSHVEDLASINVADSVAMNLAKLRVMSFLRHRIAAT